MTEIVPMLMGQDESAEEDEYDSDASSSSMGDSACRLIGPGLLVCLADTDAGCLIVAAQSGSRWGYSLLLLQIALIPVLFLAQELTIRLGIHTQQGHTSCIRKHFGARWAWSACVLLVIECIFAMISEMSGVAAVGMLWGLPRYAATIASAAIIITVVFCCKYTQVEIIGVILGLFELTFVLTMVLLHPSPADVWRGSLHFHNNPEYTKLIAANIGAVIMPWMIYFQQNAVVARNLTTEKDLKEERVHTLVGSILTQMVMIGALVTLAAAGSIKKDLETVEDIVVAIEPVLGRTTSMMCVSLGFIGGSLCAAFVVSLAATWSICEASGKDVSISLDRSPVEEPAFYGCFLAVIGIGSLVLLSGVNVVTLNVVVELMDGILMPFAVGFLYLLATGEALPKAIRVEGLHKYLLAVFFTICSFLSIVSAVHGIIS